MALTETDRRLLEQCIARVPGAWEQFVDRFTGLFIHVVRYTAHARSVQLSSDDVEDIVSEIFLNLLRNNYAVLRHFRQSAALATYLTVVARRIAVKSITQRRRSQEMGHIKAAQSSLEAAGATTGPSEALANKDEVRLLLQQLPASEAQIVRMYHLEGKSYQEISAAIGIPQGSIGPTLARARDRMRQHTVAIADAK